MGQVAGGTVVLEDLDIVWEYLAAAAAPVPSDVIFCFGSYQFGVARCAAQLYRAGMARRVLVTGGSVGRIPPYETEADAYREILLEAGVPSGAIVVEREATNTGENVALGMRTLARAGHEIASAVLVSWPTSLRRCCATFARQHPRVRTTGLPAFLGLGPYADDVQRALTTSLAELDRLDRYAEMEYVTPQSVPNAVREAARRLRVHEPAFAGAQL